jgi:hypothetical protein
MQEPDGDRESAGKTSALGAWGWFAIIVMLAILGVTIWYSIHAWGEVSGTRISPVGWVFLVLGVAVTVVVGGGLMALLFYSSRKGKDF